MSDDQVLGLFVFGLLGLVCAVILIATREANKRKPNVRVPRETLWERTNRYHGVDRG